MDVLPRSSLCLRFRLDVSVIRSHQTTYHPPNQQKEENRLEPCAINSPFKPFLITNHMAGLTRIAWTCKGSCTYANGCLFLTEGVQVTVERSLRQFAICPLWGKDGCFGECLGFEPRMAQSHKINGSVNWKLRTRIKLLQHILIISRYLIYNLGKATEKIG